MKSRILLFFLFFLLFFSILSVGQSNLDNTEKFHIGENRTIFSSCDLSPDGKTLAAATVQGFGLYLVDINTKQTIRKYDIDGYYAGPRIKFSKRGKYILLEQQFYMDWHMNKDKEVKYEVMSSTTGKIILKIENAQDAMISPDEKKLAVLKKDKIEIYKLPDGGLHRKFNLPGAQNSLCYNADGSKLLISHKFTKDDLKDFPRLARDKKALKIALKTQHAVSEYDTETMKKVRSFQEVFDHVYDMNLSYDNNRVYVMSKQSTKSGGSGMTAFIIIFNLESGEIERGGYYTNQLMGDHGDSRNGKYFGIVNTPVYSGRLVPLPEIQIYDANTYDMLTIFKFNKGWFEGFGKGEFQGGQASFDFSEDEKYLLISMGNMIYKWEINY